MQNYKNFRNPHIQCQIIPFLTTEGFMLILQSIDMGTLKSIRNIADTALTLAKTAVKSRFPGPLNVANGNEIVIMGNGPSLRQTIAEDLGKLMKRDRMAVNFAANSPEYFQLKPQHYILADPHFFKGLHSDPNVAKLWDNIFSSDWEMTLHLPVSARNELKQLRDGDWPGNIKTAFFNMTPGEGFDAVCHPLFRKRLAMPRPRNVLIPAIMESINSGYTKIYITGADHSWPHSLYVDDLNRVVSVQPHFYKDNEKELDRVAKEYAGIHIHDVLGSMAVAFRSYHQIRRFADKEGVEIYNATPGSLIDAFKRSPLPD